MTAKTIASEARNQYKTQFMPQIPKLTFCSPPPHLHQFFLYILGWKKILQFVVSFTQRQIHGLFVERIICLPSRLIQMQGSSWSTYSFSYFAHSVKLSFCQPSLKVYTFYLIISNGSPVLFFFIYISFLTVAIVRLYEGQK